MIRLDIPNLEETIQSLTGPLQHMPKECEKAAARAINRTLSAMRAEAIRIARRAYVYVPGRVFDKMYLRTARKGAVQGSLYIAGQRGISLYNFRPQPKYPGKRPPSGVSVQVRKGGVRRVHEMLGYSKPFIMKKKRGKEFGGYGVFVRKNGVKNYRKQGRHSAWKGVQMLFGASPIQSLLRKESQQQLMDKAAEVFPRRLQHEVNFQIGKLAVAGKWR